MKTCRPGDQAHVGGDRRSRPHRVVQGRHHCQGCTTVFGDRSGVPRRRSRVGRRCRAHGLSRTEPGTASSVAGVAVVVALELHGAVPARRRTRMAKRGASVPGRPGGCRDAGDLLGQGPRGRCPGGGGDDDRGAWGGGGGRWTLRPSTSVARFGPALTKYGGCRRRGRTRTEELTRRGDDAICPRYSSSLRAPRSLLGRWPEPATGPSVAAVTGAARPGGGRK